MSKPLGRGEFAPWLTEREQQKVIRFIEPDKSQPEKYRFLLLDDKREVALVWNGKTNAVCNVLLLVRPPGFLVALHSC